MMEDAIALGRPWAKSRSANFAVTVAHTTAAAARYMTEWQALADNRSDANAFYEPWCLLPALELLCTESEKRIIFVFDADRRLVGVFPMERRVRFHGLPLPHLVSWRHPHLFLAAPLVDRGCAAEVWRSFFAWARQDGMCFVDLPDMPSDGVCTVALRAATNGKLQLVDSFERAVLLRAEATAEDYIASSASAGSRKDWRRLYRRFSERGEVEIRSLQLGADAQPWIDDFLKLEGAGWKGRDKTAMASDPAAAAFFRTMANAAHARGALHMVGLFLDGHPAAMQCNLFASGQGFAFKVAFNEQWAAFSPGVLLEVEAIRDLYRRSGFVSMDACTGRDHPLMGRIWRDVRRIERLRVATNARGSALLALLGRL